MALNSLKQEIFKRMVPSLRNIKLFGSEFIKISYFLNKGSVDYAECGVRSVESVECGK